MPLDMVGRVPINVPESSFPARLYIFEDNEAVIRMIPEGNFHFDGCRPPREVYEQMCVMRCAFQIQLHQGTLMTLVPRT